MRAELLDRYTMFLEWDNPVLSDDKFPKICNINDCSTASPVEHNDMGSLP
jgi:hypothetical protein